MQYIGDMYLTKIKKQKLTLCVRDADLLVGLVGSDHGTTVSLYVLKLDIVRA